METDGIGEGGSAGQHSPRRSHVPLSGPGDTEENIDGEMPHHESAFFQCEDSAPILSWPNNQNEVNPRGLLGKWHSMERWVGISAAGLCFIIVFVTFPLVYSTWSSTPPSGVATIDYDAQAQSYLTSMMNKVEKAMNTSVDPCHDFYQYACGKWGLNDPSANDVLRSTNFEQMKLLLWKAITLKLRVDANPLVSTESSHPIQNALHSVRSLAVDYYRSCQNEELLSSRGVTPLKDVLSQMDQLYLIVSQRLEPLHAFQKVLEFVHHKLHLHVLFRWKVEADISVRDAMVIELNVPNVHFIKQGTDLQGKEKLIRTYSQYVKTLLEMVGSFNSSLDNEVNAILELFKIFRPMNGSLIGHKTTLENLNKLAPILDWQEYFNSVFNRVGIHITLDEHVFSEIQDYLSVLSKHILSEISTWGLERLYIYLRWEVAQYYSQSLHKTARDTLLPLIEELTSSNVAAYPNYRIHPCLLEVEKRLPLVFHHLVLETVSERLPEGISIKDNLKTVAGIADIIKKEFVRNIESFTWLNTNVKHVVQEKLINVNVKVGYPPVVDSPLELTEYFQDLTLTDNFFENQMELLKFNQDNLMRLLKQPHLYSDWHLITPMTVISFYAYRTNAILLPLGGLVHPVYHAYLPAYMAFASIGSLIGHELAHALDSMGHVRDFHGKVNRTLWDEATNKAFNTRVTCRVKQYIKDYYPIRHWMTTNEVLADDASVRTAFMAAASHFHPIKLPDIIMNSLATLNLSPEQFFFLYYAHMFCSSRVPKEFPLGKPKPHPPQSVRVTATLANTPQFKEVFGCDKGTKMNPKTVDCQIW
ncbi:neprilysin-3-like isoform X2 [Scylla paramamosain]